MFYVQGFTALFDNIEGDDDESISWDEFEKFFMAAGWCDPVLKTGSGGENASYNEDPDVIRTREIVGGKGDSSVRGSRTSLNGRTNGAADKESVGSSSISTKITYVVERCENEFDDIFKEIYRTTAGEGTINHLLPGQSYRFRVYSRNIDGGEGAPSDTVIVHALLETPQPPTVFGKSITPAIGSNSIILQWRSRRHGITSRDSGVVKRMIGDWTGVGEESGGVSVETAFAKYDRLISCLLLISKL